MHRKYFKLSAGAVALNLILSSPFTHSTALAKTKTGNAHANPIYSELIRNENGFGIEIPDAPNASKNIREIAIDELNIDVRETTTGLDVEYRLYGPGQAHWGSAKFTSACTLGGSKELQTWWQEAAKGKNIRKNISVTLFKSDKSPGRSYNFFECFPTAYSTVDVDLDGDGRADACEETITVKIGSGLIIAHDANTEIKGSANAFDTSISDCEGCISSERDAGWTVAAGGALRKEKNMMTFGANIDSSISLFTDAKSVSEITLKGPITPTRKNLTSWINETINGKPWKRTLTITELLSANGSVKTGKSYTYFDGFPVRYVFPRLSVTNTTGNTMEEVTIKPIRVELK